MKRFNYILYTVLLSFSAGLVACVDDKIPEEPQPAQGFLDDTDPTLPDEIKNGYSISFKMGLDQMGGKKFTRDVSNADMMEIDNFIDLEKVRILFFVCADEGTEGKTTKADTAYTNIDNVKGKPYFTGVNDHFLFESKSRWVSLLNDDESTTANWQITAPVFTYGNNDEYRWEDIRKTLETYPFKIVILANRPDVEDFGNFDSKFAQTVPFPTGRGPNWGPDDSWLPYEFRTDEEKRNLKYTEERYTINDLHHCQWDMVYSSKNSGDKETDSPAWGGEQGTGVYSFIMKNPTPTKRGPVPMPDFDNMKDPTHEENMMGAVASWSTKGDVGFGEENIAVMPSRTQGIPMYGVQVFDNIIGWVKGTPYNISDRTHGQSGEFYRKTIYMLRSVAKVELKIPRKMKLKDGTDVEIVDIVRPMFCYSNVMSRCEPLDVATPMERLWKEENWLKEDYCEWKNIADYGPIIDQDYGNGNRAKFHERMCWFYGAWRDWWDFNKTRDDCKDIQDSWFEWEGKPNPRIYNPVIQRNQQVAINPCKIDDEDFHYYVIYTGERNINDPTKFGTDNAFNTDQAHVAFLSFSIVDDTGKQGGPYCVAITDYSTNSLIKNKDIYGVDPNSKNGLELTSKYRDQMGENKTPGNWNWPLMRNHVYTFTVNSIGDYSDRGGIDVYVVSSEERNAPGYWFE
ncbi:MAG: hypothetical protein J1F43_02790 [Muribaculaceae bacterium]|nr:hypothetical protein [Muribaculaceae bacterium]